MDQTTLLCIVILIILICIINSYKNRRFNQLIGKLPSPKYNVVNMLYLIFKYWLKTGDASQATYDMFHDIAKKFENDGIFHISMYPFTNPIIFITSPKAYKDILSDQNNIFKNVSYEFLIGLIGRRNLITSGGAEWKHDRKIINPSFKYSRLISMNGVICKHVEKLMNAIKSSGNQIHDLHPHLAHAITHVILESAVGIKMAHQDWRLEDYVEGQKKYSDSIVIQAAIPIFFLAPPLFYYTIGLPVHLARRRIKNFIRDAVDERIEQLKCSGSSPGGANSYLADTLIQAHLCNPETVPKEAIIDHVTTFVFVGHKATSYTLNAILFLLASHPEKQKKLQQELDANFFPRSINELIMNNEIINRCEYLSAVIKEGQRVYPISATIGRKVTNEFICNDYIIPVGAEIMFDFNSLTKHPTAFAYKPNEFIPERFIPGGEGWDPNRHPFSFLPFSHGLRKCIGERFALSMLKVFLIKILLRYDLRTSKTMNDIKLVQDIMVYIRTPIDIKFTERLIDSRNLA